MITYYQAQFLKYQGSRAWIDKQTNETEQTLQKKINIYMEIQKYIYMEIQNLLNVAF